MREFYRSSEARGDDEDAARLHSLTLLEGAHAVGLSLADLDLQGSNVVATALLREGKRMLAPPPEARPLAGS
jgi:hypothetical protein